MGGDPPVFAAVGDALRQIAPPGRDDQSHRLVAHRVEADDVIAERQRHRYRDGASLQRPTVDIACRR